MDVLLVIPARFKSSRFPGKPLALINNKPLILHVADNCCKAISKKNIVIATDDIRIKEVLVKENYHVHMTSPNCLTGTDRVAEVAKNIFADIYINVQGDEPLINPDDILKAIEYKKNNPSKIINFYSLIGDNEDPKNKNIPKVVISETNKLIYISRAPIPESIEIKNNKVFLKQICIYAYTREELLFFANHNNKSINEKYEDIEILRFLDFDKEVLMVKTDNQSLAVDSPNDIYKVESFLKSKQ